MTAVADTSPLCYMILIEEVGLLQDLFHQVLVPTAVLAELLHEGAPVAVRGWAANLPPWVSARENPVRSTVGLEKLQAGEQAAILLAELISAELVLLDEKSARRVAAKRGLRIAGTLGILGEAAARGGWLISLRPLTDSGERTSVLSSLDEGDSRSFYRPVMGRPAILHGNEPN
jgi:predicted nucleic acid-binding protein